MQYGRFAVATLGSQKTGHVDLPTEGCCFQPAGGFTQGQYSDFQFHQALDTTFNQFGAMLQASFTDWHSGWCVAQAFALNQQAGESDAIQPLLPVLKRLRQQQLQPERLQQVQHRQASSTWTSLPSSSGKERSRQPSS